MGQKLITVNFWAAPWGWGREPGAALQGPVCAAPWCSLTDCSCHGNALLVHVEEGVLPSKQVCPCHSLSISGPAAHMWWLTSVTWGRMWFRSSSQIGWTRGYAFPGMSAPVKEISQGLYLHSCPWKNCEINERLFFATQPAALFVGQGSPGSAQLYLFWLFGWQAGWQCSPA